MVLWLELCEPHSPFSRYFLEVLIGVSATRRLQDWMEEGQGTCALLDCFCSFVCVFVDCSVCYNYWCHLSTSSLAGQCTWFWKQPAPVSRFFPPLSQNEPHQAPRDVDTTSRPTAPPYGASLGSALAHLESSRVKMLGFAVAVWAHTFLPLKDSAPTSASGPLREAEHLPHTCSGRRGRFRPGEQARNLTSASPRGSPARQLGNVVQLLWRARQLCRDVLPTLGVNSVHELGC